MRRFHRLKECSSGRRICALLLTAVLVLSMLPLDAFSVPVTKDVSETEFVELNGVFAEADGGWNEVGGTNTVLSYAQSESRTDDGSTALQFTSTGGRGYNQIDSGNVTVRPNTTYTLTYYVKQGGIVGARTFVDVYKAGTDIAVAGTVAELIDTTPHSDWTKVTQTFTTGEDTSVRFRVYYGSWTATTDPASGAYILIDDLSVFCVTESTEPESTEPEVTEPGIQTDYVELNGVFARADGGWNEVGGTNTALSYAQSESRTDDGSTALQFTSTGGRGYNQIDSGNVTVRPNTTYTLTYYVKQGGIVGARTFVDVYKAGTDIAVASTVAELIDTTPHSDWKKVTQTFTTGEDTSVRFRVYYGSWTATVDPASGAYILIDDLSVFCVTESTEPESTEPEVTEPEVTEPEVTEPEVTEPEATEPESTEFNGEFDEEKGGWYYIGGMNTGWSYDPAESYGENGTSLRLTTTGEKGYLYLDSLDVTLQTNTTYQLTYYVKQAGLVGATTYVTIYQAGTDIPVAESVAQLVDSNAHSGWMKVTQSFTTNDAQKVRLRLYFGTWTCSETAKDSYILLDELSVVMQEQPEEGEFPGENITNDNAGKNLYTNGEFVLAEGVPQENFSLLDGLGLEFSWSEPDFASKANWSIQKDTEHGNSLQVSFTQEGHSMLLHSIPWQQGKTYTVSYWVKTDGQISGLYPVVYCNDAYTPMSGLFPVSAEISYRSVPQWTQIEFSFIAPDTAENGRLAIMFHSQNSGVTAWLADVSVTEEFVWLHNGNFMYKPETAYWRGITAEEIRSDAGAQDGNVLCLTVTDKTRTVWHKQLDDPLTVGEKYTLRFRCKNDALYAKDGSAQVVLTDAEGKELLAQIQLEATHGIWKDYRIDFTAKEGFETPCLYIKLNGQTSYMFSDFSLREYEPVVKNGDFSNTENPLEGWRVEWYRGVMNPDLSGGQTYVDPSSGHTIVSDDVHGNVLKISKSSADNNVTDVYLTLNEALQIDRTYTISYWIKNNGNSALSEADAQMYSLIRKSDGNSGALYPPVSLPAAARTHGTDGKWVKVSYEFTPTAGYENMIFCLRFANRPDSSRSVVDYWIADVQITPTDTLVKNVTIPNGSFEDAIGNWPDYWGSTQIVPDCITDDQNADNVYASITKGDLTAFSGVYTQVEHILTFRLKADAAARESLKLCLTGYEDRLREEGMQSEFAELTLADTDDWQEVTVLFTAQKGVSYMDYTFSCTEGTFCIDDVQLSLSGDAQLNFSFSYADAGVPLSWSYNGEGRFYSAGGYSGSGGAISGNVGEGHLRSQQFALQPNADYELSFWICANGEFDTYTEIAVKQYDANGGPAYSTAFIYQPPNYTQQVDTLTFPWIYRTYGNTNGWRQVRVFFQTSADAAQGSLDLILNGNSSQILIDEISLVRSYGDGNLDFENADSNGNLSNWYLGGAYDSDPVMKQDRNVYHSGKASAYLKLDSLLSNEQQILNSKKIRIDATSDIRVYECSFWVASRNADIKSIQLDLWYYNAAGIKMYSESVHVLNANYSGTMKTLNSGSEISQWSQVITRVQIPENVRYVSLAFTTTMGKAEIWLDDIYFGQVEDNENIVAAHNDFHAVDHLGNISGWTATDGTLTQHQDSQEGFFGRLTTTAAGGSMVYRTNVLATDYEYALALRYRSDYQIQVQLRYYNYKQQEYIEERQQFTLPSSDQWCENVVEFTAASCASCEVVLILEQADAHLEVSQLRLFQTGKPQTKMTWTGEWISYMADFRNCDEYDHSYYRKHITLEEPVTFAPIQITGDDKFGLYVNGQKVFDNFDDATDTWANIHTLYLEEYLVQGDNVIAIDVYNQGAYSGLLFDGIWTLESGEKVFCVSDTATLCRNADPVGDWTATDYDDSGWSNAVWIGAVPVNPWGAVYFDASLYIDNNLQIKPKTGENELVNNLVYQFSVDILLDDPITSKVPMTMVLWRKNSTESICSLTPTLLTNSDMTQWPVGEWFTVEMQVELPDYISDGNYTLQLNDTYFFVSNEDVYDNRFISFKVVNDYVPTELVTKVEMINGTPTFTVNGEASPAFWFTTPFTNISAALDTIADSGIETYVNYQIMLGQMENTEGLWNENGSFNYQAMDENINTVLSASPDANIIVSIGMYAPKWWLEQNPGEVAASVDINGNITTYSGASFGSQKWKEESGEMLAQIIEHMRGQSYYARVAGIRLLCGDTYEFLTYGSQSETQLPDYSDAALAYFKQWAEQEYGTIEALREAWNEPNLKSFDDITFPTFAEMKQSSGYGMLLDPATQQKQIDFRLLLGEMTSDCLLHWAKIAKEATDEKLVVGAYYAYLFLGPNWTSLGTEHSSIEEVISSEYLDFFASPIGYNERQLGEAIYAQSVADSIRAYGKLYIAEQDNRTALSNPFAGASWANSDFSVGTTHTMEDTLLQEKRDAVYNLTNGNGQWLFDMMGGWINDPQIYELTNDINEEFNFSNYIQKDTVNDIALILPDTNTAYLRTSQPSDGDYVLSNESVIGQNMYKQHRKHLATMGTGYDVYALSTLVSGNMPEHKINVFFTPYVLTQQQRDAIDKYCKNNDQINIFLYLSGWGDEEGYDLANMTQLTGFRFGMGYNASSGQITITGQNNVLTRDLTGTTFGAQISTIKYYLQEIYVKPDSDTVVLGKLADSGKAGFVLKDMGDWTSIYAAAPYLTGDLYRNILEFAGCHIYSENPSDVVWSNGAYIGVHSAEGGTKTIALPENYAVYDVFEETYISMDTNVIVYENQVNDTHLFRLTPVNTYSFLTMVKGGHGSASTTGLEQLVPGSGKTVTFQPDEGYMVKSVTVNGEPVSLGEDNTLTFTDIGENNTIEVRFKRLPVDRTLDYEEQWVTQTTIVELPWWAVVLCIAGIAGLIVLVKWLKRRFIGG